MDPASGGRGAATEGLSTSRNMTKDRRPICPGCEQVATAKIFDGFARWSCGTPGCPVACFDDSRYPHPGFKQPQTSRRDEHERQPR